MSDFDITIKLIRCKHPDIFVQIKSNGFKTFCKNCYKNLNSGIFKEKHLML